MHPTFLFDDDCTSKSRHTLTMGAGVRRRFCADGIGLATASVLSACMIAHCKIPVESPVAHGGERVQRTLQQASFIKSLGLPPQKFSVRTTYTSSSVLKLAKT